MLLQGTDQNIWQGGRLCDGCGGHLYPIAEYVVSASADNADGKTACNVVEEAPGQSNWIVIVASYSGLLNYVSSGCESI
jgi:hypothetical protein